MKLGRDRKIVESRCRACGEPLFAATCVGRDAQPQAGNIAVCSECGHLMAFTIDLTLRELTEPEQRWAAVDLRVAAIRYAQGQLNKKKARH